jgi:hypothetical protein
MSGCPQHEDRNAAIAIAAAAERKLFISESIRWLSVNIPKNPALKNPGI